MPSSEPSYDFASLFATAVHNPSMRLECNNFGTAMRLRMKLSQWRSAYNEKVFASAGEGPYDFILLSIREPDGEKGLSAQTNAKRPDPSAPVHLIFVHADEEFVLRDRNGQPIRDIHSPAPLSDDLADIRQELDSEWDLPKEGE